MHICLIINLLYINFVSKQKMLKMAGNSLYMYAAGLLKAVCPVSGLMEQKIYSLPATGLVLFYIANKERKGYVCGITVVVN